MEEILSQYRGFMLLALLDDVIFFKIVNGYKILLLYRIKCDLEHF